MTYLICSGCVEHFIIYVFTSNLLTIISHFILLPTQTNITWKMKTITTIIQITKLSYTHLLIRSYKHFFLITFINYTVIVYSYIHFHFFHSLSHSSSHRFDHSRSERWIRNSIGKCSHAEILSQIPNSTCFNEYISMLFGSRFTTSFIPSNCMLFIIIHSPL